MSLLGLSQANTVILLSTIIGSLIMTAIFIIINYFFRKDRRKALLGKWIGNVFQVVESRGVTPFTKIIPITKGSTTTTILFDVGKPTFRAKNNSWIYMVDIDHAQILLNPKEFKVPNWEYDMALTRGTVKNVMSGINKPQVVNMLIFIGLGILCALPIGILIGKLIL